VLTLWTFTLANFGSAEVFGFGVGALILFALIRDIRERARGSEALGRKWHDIDPRPAEGRHNHPRRVVRFDGK
jgi:hypothetical protein